MMIATLKTWIGTTRELLKDPRALAIFALLYAVLLASLYFFVSTREATVWQVAITLVFLVLIPAEFFVLQSAILTHARDHKFNWGRVLRDSVKLALVALPIIIAGYVIVVLLNKLQLRFPPPAIVFPVTPGPPRTAPLHWPSLLLTTLRGLLLVIVLPLATIHLWIEVAGKEFRDLTRGGAKAIFQRLGNVLARAFAVDSVFTYALGLIFFVLIPYAVLFIIPLKSGGTRTSFAIFIARVVIAFAFTLIGWVVTLRALNITRSETTSAVPAGEIQAEAVA